MRIVTVKNTNNIWIAPLGVDQCLALMYDELPTYFKILFRKVEKCNVDYEDYKR